MTRGTKIITGLFLIDLTLLLILAISSISPEIVTLDALSKLSTVVGLIIAFGALLFAAAEYYRKKDIDAAESRPYVIASLAPKETSQNIFELVVENTGKTLAKNISIRLAPDYRPFDGVKSMNEIGIFKNMGIMTPHEKRKYFFGNYMSPEGDRSIKKEFTIMVTYTDVTGRHTYKENFSNNPQDYEGMIQNSQKGLNDIHHVLNEFIKTYKKGQR